jgi:hypothetical protein
MTPAERYRPAKIVSGGQTGVDRAALDAAQRLRIPRGGWCPRSRLAEDGRIPDDYPLEETPSSDHSQRTERNVLDSDGTLILYRGVIRGGTLLTQRLAARHKKPCLAVDLDEPVPQRNVSDWLRSNRIEVLNVAGPRESQSPGIGATAERYLLQLFGPDTQASESRP